MRVNKYLLPGFVLLSLLAAVGIARYTGYWIVSGKQMIDVDNLASTADIRGWMTLEDVASAFALDLAEFYNITGIPADVPPSTALKEMEGVLVDFEASAVREAVAAHIGEAAELNLDNPAAHETDELGVETAADAIDEEEMQSTPSGDAPVPGQPSTELGVHSEGSENGPTPVPPGQTLAAADIKGRHTLQAIAEQTNIPLKELLNSLDLPLDTETTLAVRELINAGAITEVTVVRTAVAELQEE